MTTQSDLLVLGDCGSGGRNGRPEPSQSDRETSKNNGSQYITDDRIFRTICLFFCFAVLGMTSPLVGTTLVHLERLFDVTTATISITIIGQAAAYLAGSILCGFVYDHVNHELAFAAANLVEGLGTIVAPFAGGMKAFVVALCVQGVAQGFIDASGQSYCVGLWTGHRYREPILQAMHAVWSLGGTLSPFIIARFLAELPSHQAIDTQPFPSVNSSSVRSTYDNGTDVIQNKTYTTLANADLPTFPFSTTANNPGDSVVVASVRFAYVAIGSLVLVASIFFVVAYFRGRSRRCRGAALQTKLGNDYADQEYIRDDHEDHLTDSLKPLPTFPDTRIEDVPPGGVSSTRDRSLYISFIVLTFLFFHLYLYGELTTITYLTTFTIKYLDFPVQDASLLMSLFYGFHFAGRLIGIPVSAFLRPRTMVISTLSMTAISYLLLLALVNVWPTIIWVSMGMAGLSMATTFATSVLWIGDQIPVTGRVASVMLVGSSLGGLVGPLIVGQLFDSSTPMWFVYILAIASVCHEILLAGLIYFVGRYGARLTRAAMGDDSEVSDRPTRKACATINVDSSL